MPALPRALLLGAASTLAAAGPAQSAGAPVRVSVQVVRSCQVTTTALRVRLQCSARERQTVRVQVDQQAPTLRRVSTSRSLPVDLRNARRLTLNF